MSHKTTGFFKPSTKPPKVRRHLAMKASKITAEPQSTTKLCLFSFGIIGFILTFIFVVLPPVKQPVSIESILRQRLISPKKFQSEIVTKLLSSKEYYTIVSRYEHEQKAMEAYGNLVQSHLNNRRVVSIIREESRMGNVKPVMCKQSVPDCSPYPPDLKGPLPTKIWSTATEQQQHKRNKSFQERKYNVRVHNGIWSPQHCSSRHSVAVIIPYRMRKKQLHILLQHLPAILKRQQINYSFFVIEQAGNSTFNKGILMNAGFLTALARPAHGVTFHCFIFHDVDLLAENDRNMYTCPERPRHMSVAVDELDYVLPYSELLGGVFAIRTEHFLMVNGYSNSYWGWGGEDDDMGLRVKFVFGQALRPDGDIARYSSIQHPKQKPSLSLKIRRRLKLMTRIRHRVDGLNTVKYKLVNVEEKFRYTHVLVDVGFPPKDKIYYNAGLGNRVYHMLSPNKMTVSERATHLERQ